MPRAKEKERDTVEAANENEFDENYLTENEITSCKNI
jgi:hypothetical protein